MNRPKIKIADPLIDESPIQQLRTRRTASDDIFDYLYSSIVSLKIVPGTRMSETEVARQFDVSRQPVREAFIRLDNMGLLQIRPQRATLVRKIVEREIIDESFVRTAVEVEAARQAVVHFSPQSEQLLEENLEKQWQALENQEFRRFQMLDGQFHRLVFAAGKCEFAFKTFGDRRSHVERLCMLTLTSREHYLPLFEEHKQIFDLLKARDLEPLLLKMREHLTWVDRTLSHVKTTHPGFFEA